MSLKPQPRRVRHKFQAKPCELDGFKFPSKLEARYYQRLKHRQQAGEVVFFLRQVPLHMPGGGKLVIDFVEFHADGSVHFVDAKGVETSEFKTKRRVVESVYPITIELVKS